jgi:tripartite-type tricarboxylate transporter receptor subunit TctC
VRQQAAIDMVHVPYKGAGPALADSMGGQVDAMFPSLLGAIPHIRSGRLRALAITLSRRNEVAKWIKLVKDANLQIDK